MNMNPKSSKPVLVCAFGLLAAFFMPWVSLFGAGLSGYSLGQLGSYPNYAWVIPILAGTTILLSFSGVNNRGIGAISGFFSHAASSTALCESLAREVAGHILSIGAWLTIIFSVAILIAALAPAVMGVNQANQPENGRSQESGGALLFDAAVAERVLRSPRGS